LFFWRLAMLTIEVLLMTAVLLRAAMLLERDHARQTPAAIPRSRRAGAGRDRAA
jgi:hypothetical protein